ncbi:MAG: undecaprenyl-phosphate glucose phosphotransferase [Sorangiineae bacterium NIC37A_2]|jgi:putative colanic acid biosynthesis UDP-glucose lipid carrier transferase|nr:MAG: undecaprenyl-phosphate glucose phosphotransferase [Sorangiineae bacterium NIC37A_2]
MEQGGKFRGAFFRDSTSIIPAVQRINDAVTVGLSLLFMIEIYGQVWRDQDTVALCVCLLTFYFISEVNRLYRSWGGVPLAREITLAVGTWLATIPVLLLVAFLTKQSQVYSRVVSAGWFVLAPVLMCAGRMIIRGVLYRLRKSGRSVRTGVIVGMTRTAQRLVDQLRDPAQGVRLVGFYDDRIPSRRYEITGVDVEFRGGADQLVSDVRAGSIDYVYIALPLRAESRISDLIERLSDTTATVNVVGDFFVFDMLHAQWTMVGDVPVVGILDSPFRGLGGWVKRLEDLLIGSLILLIIAIPMIVIAILVKLTSPGSVFFVQRRYGLNGEKIPVIKFRTMTVSEDGDKVTQASKNDSRVTPFGAFLRRTSLDELPQFLNVIAGHMSIVGPRPHAVAHNELYRSKIHRYMLRHKVKPGITGWAQVNGWRGETEAIYKMEKRLEHDLYYIHNWDLMLDLRIIFLTIFGKKVRSNAF